MTPLDLTIAAVTTHGWRVVLLPRLAKFPDSTPWPVTTDLDVIRRHTGNHGVMCGPESGVAVLDFDDRAIAEQMQAELGPLQAWARSGSGRGDHCYVQWQPGLPARIMWRDLKLGELQRGGMGPKGPLQQLAVLPPSIHPGTPKLNIPPGGVYLWLVDPRLPLPVLPDAWCAYLIGAPPEARPLWLPYARVVFEDDTQWDGPPAEELLRLALQQPGAHQRSAGVKFQCPGCRAEGHDRHMDNAIVMTDGRWGCAVSPEQHRRAIGEALGVATTATEIPGYDSRLLRKLGLRP